MIHYHCQTTCHLLHFKQPAGTSRGIYTTRKIWLIRLTADEWPGQQGIGECAPLPQLSQEDRPDFEAQLAHFCRQAEEKGWEALDGDIPRDDLTQGLDIAVEELADDAAIGVLADREGLSWTAAELEAIYGPIPGDGCYGLTWEGWLWAYSHSYLRQRLLERYAVRYRNDAEVHLEAALNEVRSEMTVTRSAALEHLDLASIQQRLLRASL